MRTSQSEQLEHLSCWRASGESMAAYCRLMEIPYHRMVYWRQQEQQRERQSHLGENASLGSSTAFECIELRSDSVSGHAGAVRSIVDISFPNGVRVKVQAGCCAEDLAMVTRVVSQC